jgi:small subunit ribosomal protein S1
MPEIEKNERTAAPIGRKTTVAEAPAPADEAREDGESMAAEDYERLLDMYDVSFKNFAEGEVVKGVVLQVSESEVIVDVGYKSEGIIPLDEFRDETGKISIKVGDMVDVLLEKTEDKEGYVVLS